MLIRYPFPLLAGSSQVKHEATASAPYQYGIYLTKEALMPELLKLCCIP